MRRVTRLNTYLLVALIGGVALGAACGGVVVGSGELVTRSYDLKGFTRLEVGQHFLVAVNRGEVHSVGVTVDDNLVERLRVELDGDTLRIALEGATVYQGTTQQATVTLPELTAVELSGASESSIAGFESDGPLDLKATGASSFDLRELRAGKVSFTATGASRIAGTATLSDARLRVSGASRIQLAGSGGRGVLEASGASRLELAAFTFASAAADVSGASTATVLVTGTLDAAVSGASSLRYTGSPTLGQVDVSGASHIGPLEK